MIGDAERLRTYLAGWDDSTSCLIETLRWVPDDQLVFVVRNLADRNPRVAPRATLDVMTDNEKRKRVPR